MHPKPKDHYLKKCCYFAKGKVFYECERKHEETEGSEPPNRKTFKCSLSGCILQPGNWGYATFSLGHRPLQPEKSLFGLV